MDEEEQDEIKARIIVNEAKEARLLLDLRAVRGKIEEDRRKQRER